MTNYRSGFADPHSDVATTDQIHLRLLHRPVPPRARHGLGRHLLAPEPVLCGHNRRRNPRAKLGRSQHGDGAAQRANRALAARRLAQRHRKCDEASKVQDRVEPLNSNRREQVRKCHLRLPPRQLEVDNRHEGRAWRKDEEL